MEALARVDPQGTRKIHLSFDIDATPHGPSLSLNPERRGLTLKEALILCRLIHSTGRLTAVDMVEPNPRNTMYVEQKVETACDVLVVALGGKRTPPSYAGV